MRPALVYIVAVGRTKPPHDTVSRRYTAFNWSQPTKTKPAHGYHGGFCDVIFVALVDFYAPIPSVIKNLTHFVKFVHKNCFCVRFDV